MVELSNGSIRIIVDEINGIVVGLYFDLDDTGMNWLISSDTLERYGYEDSRGFLLGKSLLRFGAVDIDTGVTNPTQMVLKEDSLTFEYKMDMLVLRHFFQIREGELFWSLGVENTNTDPVVISKMYHWLPVAYIMHERVEENLKHSCSCVPSIASDHSRILCKKRSSQGPDMVILNTGGGMKSMGSLCRYHNLFFEKSAPSLSGLILYNTVNVYKNPTVEADPFIDWQYRDMYGDIVIAPGETWSDSYSFIACKPEDINETIAIRKQALVEFPPFVPCGAVVEFNVTYTAKVSKVTVFSVGKAGIVHKVSKYKSISMKGGERLEIQSFNHPGERKLVIDFEDGTTTFVIMTVYDSLERFVEVFCDDIYNNKFINDPKSPHYCGYQTLSKQGEACAKGSLLLVKNLMTQINPEEIRQVEYNAVHYLRTRWLDEDFLAKKLYHGGFARIFDLDYLILEFYLLSLFDDDLLQLHSANTYLIWAYRTAVYRMSVTPDKIGREVVEVNSASMFSWYQIEMIDTLRQRGYTAEAKHLDVLWEKLVEVQMDKIENGTFIETEHYFDNAGISVVGEMLLNSGHISEGMKAARLLLANVADSNDYRSYAPDRWWEALSFMYHNLWAVFTAKTLLTAYEKTLDNRYLFAAYRAMIPMFYNYDWNVRSALNSIKMGQGVSAYCVTNPNLNLEYASRNRFGQSVFKDDFFTHIDIDGDDWDLGADVIVYLCTFGRKTYITKKDEEIVCVNGLLKGNQDAFEIISYAAYPLEYLIEPLELWIRCGTKGYVLRSIVLIDGQCVKVKVKIYERNPCVTLICSRNGVEWRIFPDIEYVD